MEDVKLSIVLANKLWIEVRKWKQSSQEDRATNVSVLVGDPQKAIAVAKRALSSDSKSLIDAAQKVLLELGASEQPQPSQRISSAAIVANAEIASGNIPPENVLNAVKYASRELLNLLGPMSGDDLSYRLEKCKTEQDTIAMLEKCRGIVEGMSGKKKSEVFWSGVVDKLNGI